MLICAILAVLWLVAFPTTALGRALRECLVEMPARRLSRITLGQIAFYCALAIAGAGLFWLFEAEGVRLFSLMAPDVIVWFTLFDVSVFLDVFLLTVALAATARFRVIVSATVSGFRRIRSAVIARVSGREGETRPRTTRGDKASDDPDPAGYALAMA